MMRKARPAIHKVNVARIGLPFSLGELSTAWRLAHAADGFQNPRPLLAARRTGA